MFLKFGALFLAGLLIALGVAIAGEINDPYVLKEGLTFMRINAIIDARPKANRPLPGTQR